MFTSRTSAWPWTGMGSLQATFASERHQGAVLASHALQAPPAACRNLTGSLREGALQDTRISVTDWNRKLSEQLLAVSENRGICTKVGPATPLCTLAVTYWGFSVLLTPWAAARQLGSLDRWSTIAVLIILNEIAPKWQHSRCCPLQGDSPRREHGGQVKVWVAKAPGWPPHRLGVPARRAHRAQRVTNPSNNLTVPALLGPALGAHAKFRSSSTCQQGIFSPVRCFIFHLQNETKPEKQ